jgi:hypothetical protein
MRERRPRDHDDTTNNSAKRRLDMPISVAFVDTAHFSFHGLGDTPQQAVDAVIRAWAHHVRLTGAYPDHVTRDDVTVITGEPGAAFRDHSPFPPARHRGPTDTRTSAATRPAGVTRHD